MTEEEAIARIRVVSNRRGLFRVYDVSDERQPKLLSEHRDHSAALKAWREECKKLVDTVDARGVCPSRANGGSHLPMRAKIDPSVWCTRCGAYLGEVN